MGRFIIRLDSDTWSGGPWYLEWSTVVDAPVMYGLPREQFIAYMSLMAPARRQWGETDDTEARVARADEHGCSALDCTDLDELLQDNRAGRNETMLTYDELVWHYCVCRCGGWT